MERMKQCNRLENLKIIAVGLSNTKKKLYHGKVDDNNTGGTNWHSEKLKESLQDNPKEGESGKFETADDLFADVSIGLYHIDVENHEKDVLNGSKKLLQRCKPIIAIEHWKGSKKCTNATDCPEFYNFMASLDYRFARKLSNDDFLFLHASK